MQLLYEAAGEGSWLEIVEKAGHCDFLSVGIAIETACSVACFPGTAFNRVSAPLLSPGRHLHTSLYRINNAFRLALNRAWNAADADREVQCRHAVTPPEL